MARTMAPPSDNLYISGLPEDIDETMLNQIFSGYGSIVRSRVLPGGSGPRAAQVQYMTMDEAAWVVNNVSGNIPQGLDSAVNIRFANPNPKMARTQYGQMGAPPVPGAEYTPRAKMARITPPKQSDNLFMSGLPDGLTDDILRSTFQNYGTVTQCKVLTGSKHGYAAGFVRFASPQMAKWVLENLNDKIPNGLNEPVQISYAKSRGDDEQPGNQMFQMPMAQGNNNMKPGVMVQPGMNGGMQQWMPVKNEMLSSPFTGVSKKLVSSGILPGGKGSDNEANAVYIGNLPKCTKNEDIYELFASFGAIPPRGVRVMLGDDGMCRGFGFVNYLDHSCAASAINAMNGVELNDGQTLKVSLKSPPKNPKSPGQ